MNFALDGDGDLAMTANNITLIDGKSEIQQIIKCNLQAVAGEWFLDGTLGLPWFEQILEKQNSDTNIDNIFLEAIRTSAGVISVTRFVSSLDRSTRTLSIDFSVLTVDGIIDFNDQISAGGL